MENKLETTILWGLYRGFGGLLASLAPPSLSCGSCWKLLKDRPVQQSVRCQKIVDVLTHQDIRFGGPVRHA